MRQHPKPQDKPPQTAARPSFTSSLLSRILSISDYFAYPLRSSHYLALINPLWSTHALQARVEKVWDETKDARTLTLRPGLAWRPHRAGQHLRIGVPIGGMHHTRTYTISSPPERDDGCITITVKAIDGGRISHHLVRKVAVGDYLPIGLPHGDFYLPEAQPIKPLFITAGSGITPVISMLRSQLARKHLRDSVHIHYAPHEFDVIFGKEIKQMLQQQPNYHLQQVFTHEYGALKQTKGYFSAEQLSRLCPDWREREVYACGPAGLLAALEKHYEQAGMTRHLNIERFRAELAEVPSGALGGQVRFIKSGIEVTANATTNLLRVAEDAGMNPSHGCRMGICHTCNTRLVSGHVRDLRSGKVISGAGSIVQLCICATTGDCELEL